MDITKISISDRDVVRRRRVQSNCAVSYWREHFDGDGHTSQVSYGRKPSKPNFGTSKMEYKVSNHYLIKPLTGEVNGA